MDVHRHRSKEPVKRVLPTHVATGSNQVLIWDITWLNASVKGQYYKLYLIVNVFSRISLGAKYREQKIIQNTLKR